MMKMTSFDTTEALIDATETLLRDWLAKPATLLLSGGSSPYAVYNRIAARPSPLHPELLFFMGDERMVPPDSDQNNFHNLQPMIRALRAEKQCFAPDTTRPIQEATSAFAQKVAPLKSIDLALLGIGADGHTCGFFTLEQASINDHPLALFTDRPDGMRGITITPAILKRANHILILAPGKSKRDILQTLQNAPQTIPAGVALANHPNTEIWTDQSI
jgi:6-phosphogluconolactonase